MRLSFGLLQVTLKYTYRRGDTIFYQRAVPTKLTSRYPGKTIKHDLKTASLSVAEKSVAALNARYEAEWAGLLAAPESSPKALKAHADAFLKGRGLAPGSPENHPMAVELLHDHIDQKRMQYAGGDEWVHRNAAPEDYLSPVEIEAGKRLHGTAPVTLNDALELHLRIHPKRDDAKFVEYQRRAFATLTAVTGDKGMEAFGREDARRYMDLALLTKVKTATVRRRMGVMRAVVSTYIKENNLPRPNPFAELAMPGEGEDKKKRVPFTAAELAALYAACHAKDDDLRWLLALLTDTGARLAEVVGLSLADIVLDETTPHVVIQPHPWRSLKNAGSARKVPLVGASLWAAQRVKAKAIKGQLFAFPRYTAASECKATHASNTLVSWVRRLPLNHTVHELRHTMADRLRAVQCPKDIRYAIDGHAAQDVGDTYGTGYGLQVKAEWLAKVALSLP